MRVYRSCILALSLVASTRHGCDALMNYGYQSVRHSSDALWPVTTPASAEAQHQLGSRMHSDTIDAGSTSESGDELSPEGGNLLGASRLIKRSLSTAETRISSSMSIALSTTSIDDLEAFSPEDADGPILAGSGGVQSLRSFKSSATIMGVSTQSEHLQFSRSSTQPSSMRSVARAMCTSAQSMLVHARVCSFAPLLVVMLHTVISDVILLGRHHFTVLSKLVVIVCVCLCVCVCVCVYVCTCVYVYLYAHTLHADSGGNMRARRKASHPMGRKGSIQMVGDAGSGFVGICLPTDIDRLFQVSNSSSVWCPCLYMCTEP